MGWDGGITGKALGMVEVFGMLGAVEAADSALKAASVTLLGVRKVKGGIVTVLLAGDVASVRAAVDAAAASVEKLRVGMRWVHVIPRPHREVWQMLVPAPGGQEVPPSGGSEPAEETDSAHGFLVDPNGGGEASVPISPQKEASPSDRELEAMTVMELRRLARSLPVGMSRKRIKFASKEELLREIRSFMGEGGGDGGAG